MNFIKVKTSAQKKPPLKEWKGIPQIRARYFTCMHTTCHIYTMSQIPVSFIYKTKDSYLGDVNNSYNPVLKMNQKTSKNT